MQIAVEISRLVLFALFFVAAIAKLIDYRGWRQSLFGFQIPANLVPAVSVALPGLELVVGIGLLVSQLYRAAAITLFCLLLLFTVVLVLNLLQGRAPTCRCFGNLSARPISWQTVGRNVVLAATAALVIAAEPFGLATSFSATAILGTIIASLFLAESLLIRELILQNGRLLLRVDALEAEAGFREGELRLGMRAPIFESTDMSGRLVSLDSLRGHRLPIMLLFWSPFCSACSILLPDIRRWQRDCYEELTLAVITTGGIAANKHLADLTNVCVLLDEKSDVAARYNVRATPTAVIVRPDGAVAVPPLGGVAAVRTFVEQFLRAKHAHQEVSNE